MKAKKPTGNGRIEVRGPVDYENDLEGGYNYIYEVVSCNVGVEAGTLTWDRVRFPVLAASAGGSLSGVGSTVSRSNPTVNQVRTMSRVGDDVLELLRERGVDVVIDRQPSSVFSID